MRSIRQWMRPAGLMILALLMVSCGGSQDDLLAKVGTETITMQDLRDEMIRVHRSETSAARKSLEQREEALETLVERRLKIEGARVEGYFDDPEVVEKRERFIVDAMLNRLHELEVLEKVVTEADARAIYDQQGIEVEASHILLRWTADSSEVRRRADEIAHELRKGLPFADAAAQYTEEPGGADRGGELGWFTWGRMVPAFQEACWELEPGEVSDAVETQFGVHLIHVTGRRDVTNRPSFEEQKSALIDAARRQKQDSIRELGEAFVENMKEEFGYQVDEDAAAELLAGIHANLKPERKLKDIFREDLATEWDGRTFAVWESGSVTLDDLTDSMDRNFRQAGSITTAQDVIDMIDFAALFPMLERVGRSRGLDKDPAILAAADEQIEGSVLMRYERERIKGSANVTDEECEAWYRDHPDDYMHPKTVRVQEIYVKDKEEAQRLAERARKGEDFGRLAKKYTERPGKQGTDGTLEAFQSGRYGKMGEAAFQMAVGEISDPLPIGRSWSVIKLLEQIPPRPKSFDESKTSIRMKLERQARTENQAAWRSEIEQLVKVVTHPGKLNRLFADQPE